MKPENIQKLKEIHMDEYDLPEIVAECTAEVNGKAMDASVPELAEKISREALSALFGMLKQRDRDKDPGIQISSWRMKKNEP